MLFCFKQLPLNAEEEFESPYHLIDGEKLLSVVADVIIFWLTNLYISMIQLFQYNLVFLKYNKMVKILSKVVFPNVRSNFDQ